MAFMVAAQDIHDYRIFRARRLWSTRGSSLRDVGREERGAERRLEMSLRNRNIFTTRQGLFLREKLGCRKK